jgi:hypothetical protein
MINSGIAAWRPMGGTGYLPFYLSYLANAHANLGQIDDAWRCMDEAMTTIKIKAASPTFSFRPRRDYFPDFVQGRAVAIASLLLYGTDAACKNLVADNPQPAVPDMTNLNKSEFGYVDVTLNKSAKQGFLIIQYSAAAA